MQYDVIIIGSSKKCNVTKTNQLGVIDMKNRIEHESGRKTERESYPISISDKTFAVIAEIVRSRVTTFIFCILLTGNVFAQQEDTLLAIDSSSSGKIFNQAINMCPGGIAFGIYSINYEYLFVQTHGLVSRFDYESVSETISDDDIKADGYAFTLNYRWHLSEAMESFYLGLYARYKIYKGNGSSGSIKFDFTLHDFTLGLNAGKRWVWNSGINVNVAFGYGISTLSKETEPANPDVEATLNKFIEEYTFIDPFYGEISIGYAF